MSPAANGNIKTKSHSVNAANLVHMAPRMMELISSLHQLGHFEQMVRELKQKQASLDTIDQNP
jgi:hypothetical protein